MSVRSSTIAACLAFTALFATACGNAEDTSSGTATTSGTPTSSAPSETKIETAKPTGLSTRKTAPAALGPLLTPTWTDFDPCAVLTADEVAATTGEPQQPGEVMMATVQTPEGESVSATSGCTWGSQEGSAAIEFLQSDQIINMGERAVIADIEGREVILMFGNQARCNMYVHYSGFRLAIMDVKARPGDGRTPDDLCNQSLSLLTTVVSNLDWV
ncbi:DUF3558 family protein [Rhodococcus sp. NPDC049939]|uniref:DUF3558 family protein n=1 Tax=Rhodococcus sp. NPDC049939 TaxID=3155511 RepID=UPI0033C0D6C2